MSPIGTKTQFHFDRTKFHFIIVKNPDRFVAIRLVVRHGYLMPWIIAGIALLSCGWIAWREASVPWAVAGIVLGLVLLVVLRVAVEVVDLVAETLLPR